MAEKTLHLPVAEDEVRDLRVGDLVYIDGIVYTARDMAHLRLKGILSEGGSPPVRLDGMAVFHAGPVVMKSGEDAWELIVIGPTTSIRMEPHADMIGSLGVRLVIGKGGMDEASSRAFKKYGGVYLQAAPGCAVTLARGIERVEGVQWLDLGMPEAMWTLVARGLGPFVVGMDSHGESIYRSLKRRAYEILDAMYPVNATTTASVGCPSR